MHHRKVPNEIRKYYALSIGPTLAGFQYVGQVFEATRVATGINPEFESEYPTILLGRNTKENLVPSGAKIKNLRGDASGVKSGKKKFPPHNESKGVRLGTSSIREQCFDYTCSELPTFELNEREPPLLQRPRLQAEEGEVEP